MLPVFVCMQTYLLKDYKKDNVEEKNPLSTQSKTEKKKTVHIASDQSP